MHDAAFWGLFAVFATLISAVSILPLGQDAVTKLFLLSVLGIRYVTIPDDLSWQHSRIEKQLATVSVPQWGHCKRDA